MYTLCDNMATPPHAGLAFHRYLQAQLARIVPPEEVRGHEDLLVRRLLGMPLNRLFVWEGQVESGVLGEAKRLLVELESGKPIQYVLGECYFYNVTLELNAATLIPRRETEELCALAEQRLAEMGRNGGPMRVLDMGTGSGGIAIALQRAIAAQRGEGAVEMMGLDVCEEALRMARRNAARNAAAVRFVRGDMLGGTIGGVELGGFDLLVSNPPYIPLSEREGMSRRVVEWEPHGALFVPDDDPLLFYRALARHALCLLREGGYLLCEAHEHFADAAARLFEGEGLRRVRVYSDAQGRPRIVEAVRGAEG